MKRKSYEEQNSGSESDSVGGRNKAIKGSTID